MKITQNYYIECITNTYCRYVQGGGEYKVGTSQENFQKITKINEIQKVVPNLTEIT
jgi:hypothetical protein